MWHVKAVRLYVQNDTAFGIWFSACNSFLLPLLGRKLTAWVTFHKHELRTFIIISNIGISRLKL